MHSFSASFALSATLLLATPVDACSPPPVPVKLIRPSPEATERGAIDTFRKAIYVAQVTVIKRPQLLGRGSNGVLRVDAAIKGKPPRYLPAYPDICESRFQRVGERRIVAVFARDLFSMPLDESGIAVLKRRRMGDWRNVH